MIRHKKTAALLMLVMGLILNPGCFSDSSGGDSSTSTGGSNTNPLTGTNYIADHNVARLSVLDSIPDSVINNTKVKCIIGYGHTSHGSQIVDGVNGLVAFMNGRGKTTDLFKGLDFRRDLGNYGKPYGAADLNQPDYTAWEAATRSYLSSHSDVNVIMWSWCGGVSHASEANITTYLTLMNGLETDYPNIKFVYMTGHLDGSGLTGNLHLRNEQIRKYCKDNNKNLFDFADIETYNPDGVYFGDKNASDSCAYNGGNWATEWQNAHTVNVDWYNCSSAHSQPVNANMKAYAFWWLMARLAGWDGN